MTIRDHGWRDTGKGYKTRKIKSKKGPVTKGVTGRKVGLKAAQNIKKSAARSK